MILRLSLGALANPLSYYFIAAKYSDNFVIPFKG